MWYTILFHQSRNEATMIEKDANKLFSKTPMKHNSVNAKVQNIGLDTWNWADMLSQPQLKIQCLP